MKFLPHVALSTAAGGLVWTVTGEPASVPIAVAAGVLPDTDHLVDYYVKYIRRNGRFQFLLLHGWEYLLIGIIAYAFWLPEPWLLAVVAGYATQIAGDQVSHDDARWNTYLITTRAVRGFRAPNHGGRGNGRAYQSLVDSVPFGRETLTGWFERRLPESTGPACLRHSGTAEPDPFPDPVVMQTHGVGPGSLPKSPSPASTPTLPAVRSVSQPPCCCKTSPG